MSAPEQNVGRLVAGDALVDYLAFVVELQAERIAELEHRLDDLDRPGGAITELRCAVGVVIGELDGLRPADAQRKVA